MPGTISEEGQNCRTCNPHGRNCSEELCNVFVFHPCVLGKGEAESLRLGSGADVHCRRRADGPATLLRTGLGGKDRYGNVGTDLQSSADIPVLRIKLARHAERSKEAVRRERGFQNCRTWYPHGRDYSGVCVMCCCFFILTMVGVRWVCELTESDDRRTLE